MKCEYCQSKNQSGEVCDKCGAKLPERNEEIWKSDPFLFNGYIVYSIRNRAADTYEMQFWLGRELIERIEVPGFVLEERVPRGNDYMFFFWDLFLVAQGEEEVIKWQEKNKKYPAQFEIRRIENREKQDVLALYSNWQQVRESKL